MRSQMPKLQVGANLDKHSSLSGDNITLYITSEYVPMLPAKAKNGSKHLQASLRQTTLTKLEEPTQHTENFRGLSNKPLIHPVQAVAGFPLGS